MPRFFTPFRMAVALALAAVTGCTPAGKQLMGDPRDPYPRTVPAKVGEIVHLPTGIPVSSAQMLAVARDARIVYVGETHDNPASHRLELELLKGLAESRPGELALGMEMFVRSQQPVLDRWVAGSLDEKAFLKESNWFENWKMDYGYYRDLLRFARDHKIPVIALNAEKGQVAAVRRGPPSQLPAGEQAGLPELDLSDPYQRGMVAAIYGGHTQGKMQLEGFVRAQTLWDETMAESVAGYLASPAGERKQMLVIAGGHHVSYGFGIPRRVFRRLPASYVVICGQEIDIPQEKENQIMDVELPRFPMRPYDFVVYLAYEKLPEAGVRLGVTMDRGPGGHGVVVKSVMADSNAERAGLKSGDLLLTLDNEQLDDTFDLVYAVKRKKAGEHGVLQVERQGKTEEVEVLFQAAGTEKTPGKK
jgi:uncharacterized iron-regulated protein